jgi:transposase InsO family protein
VKFAWIQAHRQEFEVETLCAVLDVSRSGFYAWNGRGPSERKKRSDELLNEIRRVHAESRRIYGSPRVFKELNELGIKGCENTIAKLMSKAEIHSKIVKKYVPKTTDSKHAHPLADNLLERNFKAEKPNRKWAVDITYVDTGEGFLFVAAVLDLCSRMVVGWSMAEHMRSELVEGALRMALKRRKPGAGVLHHSDRGVQYAGGAYRALLETYGFECSMSRTGNCYDNAMMESFWSSLKTECVYHEKYATREQARLSVFEYIEVFYNRVRRHSSLGYVSPEAFEAALN